MNAPGDTALFSRRHWLVGLSMLLAALLAANLKPTRRLADQNGPIALESRVPAQFDGWRLDDRIVPILPDPQQQATLDKIYSQSLSRTYVNGHGQRVMLTIAYGSVQSDTLQVHKPEVCYASQGFQVDSPADAVLPTDAGDIPVKRLVAVNGLRIEPITYWILIGDKVTGGGSLAWKLAQLKLGFQGVIPDGLLFRVSSIGSDQQAEYALQRDFVNALLNAMSEADRRRFIGRLGRPTDAAGGQTGIPAP